MCVNIEGGGAPLWRIVFRSRAAACDVLLFLDDHRGDHSEHPILALGVVQDVAVGKREVPSDE